MRDPAVGKDNMHLSYRPQKGQGQQYWKEKAFVVEAHHFMAIEYLLGFKSINIIFLAYKVGVRKKILLS